MALLQSCCQSVVESRAAAVHGTTETDHRKCPWSSRAGRKRQWCSSAPASSSTAVRRQRRRRQQWRRGRQPRRPAHSPAGPGQRPPPGPPPLHAAAWRAMTAPFHQIAQSAHSTIRTDLLLHGGRFRLRNHGCHHATWHPAIEVISAAAWSPTCVRWVPSVPCVCSPSARWDAV